MEAKTKQNLASALCKHLSVSPEGVELDQKSDDIKSLYSRIVHLSGKLITQDNTNNDNNNHDEEVMKWIAFAESFPVNDSRGSLEDLTRLNQDLLYKSVILGNGLTPSAADVILFSVIHSFVIGLSDSEREKLPHVIRWMDYIQSKEDFGNLFEKLPIQMDAFEPPHFRKDVGKLEVDSVANKNMQSTKNAEKPETDPNKKKSDVGKKGNKEPIQEKKTTPETAAGEKDKDISVSLLNIQVGLIRRAWKHPSADSLLVEEIDVGEAKLRQVVSGLAKYCSPDELTNRQVVLITNVKPGKLRDVMSEGLVLCASNEDHTVVEPLLPPEGAKIGERILFSGVDGKPEDVLNPKKKQLEKITPHLFTDDNGVATYKGMPFMTSGGPCTSTIPKASIK